jgi:hypothetical protein
MVSAMSEHHDSNAAEPVAEDVSAANEPASNSDPSEVAPTPFDHPLFLPVVCIGFAIWFGYDTYIQPLEEHLDFNFYGFKLVLAAALWYGYQGWAEIKRQPVKPWVLPSIFALFAAWLGIEAFGVAGFEHGELIEYPILSLYGFYLFAALIPLAAIRESMRVRRAGRTTTDPQV